MTVIGGPLLTGSLAQASHIHYRIYTVVLVGVQIPGKKAKARPMSHHQFLNLQQLILNIFHPDS